MTGIKKRLGSMLGPRGLPGEDGQEGATPQFVEGNTTQVAPSEPAKVDLVKTGETEYRIDIQVPRGLDGDPTAVANFGEALATEINTDNSAGQIALSTAYMPNSILNLAPKPPAGFRGLSTLPTPTIRRNMQGKFTAELDIEALRPPAGVTYYTAPDAPSTGNDGLSPESPMRLISILNDAPDVGTIIYAPGEYYRDGSGTDNPPPKSINHIGDGNVTLTGFNSPRAVTWSQVSGHVYQGTRSGTENIFDVEHLTSWGDYTQYEEMSSLSEITGPGQWAADGSTVYVWAIGNTDLSQAENREQIRLQVAQALSLVADQGTTHYVEGINFWGAEVLSGRGGLIAKNNSLIIAKNCSVKYNHTNGFMTTGGHMIAIDCEASSNGRDGFNYHDVENNGGEFIEIGCHSHHNGRHRGRGTNNATTAHEAVTGIRVNGVYEHTAGPVVADVNDSHTWNLGCVSGGPDFPVTTGQDSSWRTDGSSEIWVDECESHSATTAYTTAGGVIYVHSSGYANEREVGGGSNVRNYTR